eukprot:gene21259-28179_t
MLPGAAGKADFRQAMENIAGAAGKADLRQAINDNLEGFAGGGSEPTVSDLHLLDEATREEVMARARIVAEAGAIHPLILMCYGPAGPLEDLEAKAAAPPMAGAVHPLILMCNGPAGPLEDLEAKAAAPP